MSDVRPSFYALERGGWRDYVTLLHLPYTAWHLSYVVIGGCLATEVAWERLGAAVVAFALAVGVGAHALDELSGRPLRTRIPSSVLVTLAAVSIGTASAIGVIGALSFRLWLVALRSVVRTGVGRLPCHLRVRGGRRRDRRRRGDRRGVRGFAVTRSKDALEPRPLRSPASRRRQRCSRAT